MVINLLTYLTPDSRITYELYVKNAVCFCFAQFIMYKVSNGTLPRPRDFKAPLGRQIVPVPLIFVNFYVQARDVFFEKRACKPSQVKVETRCVPIITKISTYRD